MPELPEVEVIRRGLQVLIGQRISQVKIFTQKSLIGDSSIILNAGIATVSRRGKALLISLDNDHTLLIHLRMTGQLIWRSDSASADFAGGHPTDDFFADLPNRQTRVMILLSGGRLFFNDQRKFGFVKIIPTSELDQESFLARLAPEPFALSAADFHARLSRHPKANIKSVVLNQQVVAGVGNIYADEGLFYAGIDPRRLAGSLTPAESAQLLAGFAKVMNQSIAAGGSTMATYVNADGKKGDYLAAFAQVFARDGQICPRCGGLISKIKVAGRGTHVCFNCQH